MAFILQVERGIGSLCKEDVLGQNLVLVSKTQNVQIFDSVSVQLSRTDNLFKGYKVSNAIQKSRGSIMEPVPMPALKSMKENRN